VLPGARELLDELRPRYRIAALSNSNELHWKRNTEELGITGMFEFALSSHQLGVCKPDPQIFRIAVDRARVSAPEAIVFFDDLPANVEAAKSAGLRAFEVRGVDSLRGATGQRRAALKTEYGFLVPVPGFQVRGGRWNEGGTGTRNPVR
jgi:putative hydrolase of the HAD superfamily